MAIYESYKKYLIEADDDDNAGDGGQNVDVGPDDAYNGGDQGDQNNQDNPDDNGNDNNDNNDDNQDQNDDNDDGYDISADDDGGGGDTANDTGDTSGDEEGTDEEQPPEVENPGLDKIYERMTPEEKSHHDHELRQQYKKIFRAINILIEKTVALPRTSQTIDATTSLLHTLFAFKKYLIFYIEKKYESKTLIENTIEYWKYTSILSSYKAIYKELEKVLVHDDKDD